MTTLFSRFNTTWLSIWKMIPCIVEKICNWIINLIIQIQMCKVNIFTAVHLIFFYVHNADDVTISTNMEGIYRISFFVCALRKQHGNIRLAASWAKRKSRRYREGETGADPFDMHLLAWGSRCVGGRSFSVSHNTDPLRADYHLFQYTRPGWQWPRADRRLIIPSARAHLYENNYGPVGISLQNIITELNFY